MHSKRFIPFAIAFLSLVFLEVLIFKPDFIYALLAVINALIFAGVWRMAEKSLIDRRWWIFLILPILFFDGLATYSSLMPYKSDKMLMQLLFAVDASFLYFYLRSVYYHLVLPTAERKMSLENISGFGNFISLFFIAATVYGLESFLNIPAWPLALAMLVSVGLLTYQIFFASRISFEKSLIYIIIITLVLTELAWVMFYLPFNFNVSGAILAIEYYMMIGLARARLNDQLDARSLKLYLGFGFSTIFVILISSRWL